MDIFLAVISVILILYTVKLIVAGIFNRMMGNFFKFILNIPVVNTPIKPHYKMINGVWVQVYNK